jgi:glutamate carboxypeptidase
MHSYISDLQWIENQYQRLLDYVNKWAAVNSFSENIPGLSDLSEILIHDFSLLEGKSESFILPPRKTVNDKGLIIKTPLGRAISFKKRPQSPIQVLLTGHMDTVFSPESSFQTIEKIDSAIWQGPGVADMKGGLAIMLIALEALERSAYADKIGWEIIINPDEELGSPGSAYLFEEAAKRNQIGLIFEPAFPDGAFVSQRKGSASYTVVVHGKAAHVGRDYLQGCSAIYALTELIHKLEQIQSLNPEFMINVGHIEGGGPINIVPNLAIARINIRSSNREIIENSLQTIQAVADQVSLRKGIKAEVIAGSLRFPKPMDRATQSLFNAYSECAKLLNQPFSLRETGGVCDGNLLAHAGLPTMDSLGAIGGNLHTHQEYLILSSLVDRAKLAALFLFKLASGAIELKEIYNHV